MSERSRAAVIALATVLASLAGCIGTLDDGGIPSNIEVDASQPLVAQQWAYEGSSVSNASGQARLVADNSSGSGSFAANLTMASSAWTVSTDSFQAREDQPWTANGVNQSIRLHGDTGRGLTELPAMRAIVATWGPMQVTRGDEVLADPLTGQPTFVGHILVTDAGVRSSDGSIQAQDGSVYGPSKAGSGQTLPGDPELHLVVTSDPDASVREGASVQDSGQLTPQQANASMAFPIQQTTANASVTVSVSSPTDAPLPPSETSVELVGPSGTATEQATLGGTGNTTVTFSSFETQQTGNYSVELQTDGTANWNATASVDYPDPFLLHATFEQVTWRAAGASGS